MWSISWLLVLEAVVIVTGNIITVVIFTGTPHLRRRQYALIISLAVADLLVGLISVPMHIASAEISVENQSVFFLLVYFMQDVFFGSASLFGLAALAIERLHATYFPFRHNTLGRVSYIVGIAVVWMLALVVGFASYNILTSIMIYLILKTTIVTISLIIICTAYLLILVKVRCHGTHHDMSIHHENKKLTVTLAIVTTISLITWVPYQFITFYPVFNPVTSTYWIVRSVSKVLHFGNSLANFFVYAFRMREFKTVLIRRITCRGSQVSPRDDVELANTFRRNVKKTSPQASVIND